ncbi:MAG TPA: hypothetical protein PK733_09995 [Clostridiales bacterium]|nr:hypothetical protein [Clostridiales bacterium]
MYSIKFSNVQSLLYDKGILLLSREICKNKINLISGVYPVQLLPHLLKLYGHLLRMILKLWKGLLLFSLLFIRS